MTNMHTVDDSGSTWMLVNESAKLNATELDDQMHPLMEMHPQAGSQT